MRRIEFRVWDVDEKEWYNNEKIPYQLIDNEGVFCWADDYEWNRYPGEVLIVQYTGLKDRNGTEIYEGDIIWDAHAEIHGKVTFDEGMFCVEWATHIEQLFEVVSDYYAEVMGNIYEHPELLGDNQ